MFGYDPTTIPAELSADELNDVARGLYAAASEATGRHDWVTLSYQGDLFAYACADLLGIDIDED